MRREFVIAALLMIPSAILWAWIISVMWGLFYG